MIDRIYNEDCLEGMKRIPDGIVDAIICDPPFGITDAPFDKRLPFEPMWEQFKRVTKHNAAIVLFSQMPFGAELIMSNRKMFRYEWIVEKKSAGGGFLNAKKMPLRSHENILIFYRALPTYNPQWTFKKPYKAVPHSFSVNYANQKPTMQISEDGRRYPRDVLRYTFPHKIHSQRKPVDLIEYLIKTYSNEGELVLDATIGSGTTAVACIKTGRHFIGFETEKKFCDIANERIEKALAEKTAALF